MFAGTSHGTELKRFFRLPLTRAALAVMLLIPLLYGAMYVWAFWDPTDRMNEMPIALVNEDRPTMLDGEVLAAGQETVDKLVEEKPFDWKIVDAAEAADGVKHGRYYFAVTIPADYSSSIASLKGDNPVRARINVTYDDSNSFLASTLGESAMLRVKEAVNETSGQQAVDKLLIGLGDARDGLGQASDGAFELRDGLKKATVGTEKLQVGAEELDKGASALADGGSQLAAGTASAVKQTAPLAPGVAKLNSGAEQLAGGLDALDAKVPTLASGVHQVAVGSAQAASGASTLASSQKAYVAGVTKAGQGVAQLQGGTVTLDDLLAAMAQLNDPTTGAPALAAGATQVSDGVDELAGGVQTLVTGADALAKGAADYSAGATKFAQGATQLAGKTDGLAAGVTELKAGADKAKAGAAQVSTGATDLNTGLQALNTSLASDGQLAAALNSDDPAVRQAALTQLRTSVQAASTGSAKLATGAPAVADGTSQLAAGLYDMDSQLAPAAGQLHAGAAGLTAAAKDLGDGSARLTAGVTELKAGTGRLVELQAGAHQVAAGSSKLAAGINEMTTRASSPQGLPAMIAGINQLNDGFANPSPQKGLVAGATALSAGADQLSSGTAALSAGAAKLDAGTGQLADGVNQLVAGSHQLADGTNKLNSTVPALVSGVQQLDAGAAKIADGSAKLADGTNTLATKVPELSDGLVKATDGSDELATKLQEGQQEIPDDSAAVREQRSTAMQSPADLNEVWVAKAASWGEGFAPFFIPLALWVGALITWLLLRPLQTRPLMTSVSGFRTAWGSLNSALVLAIGQVLIMLGVMRWAIGLDIEHKIATIGFTLLTAFAFMALQQFFQVAFGPAPGKVIVIALLMVQLASAGGTYPIETEPALLRAINPYMPMTYVVQGLRESITGGIDHRFWVAVIVLAAIFVVSLIGSSVMAARKRMWSMSRLHPALSI